MMGFISREVTGDIGKMGYSNCAKEGLAKPEGRK